MSMVHTKLLLPVACLAGTIFATPFGLVLGGGGAKGAYEVGVWETLVEEGIAPNVRVISGTSVGAINAALFATCTDTGRMERVWLESLPKVMVRNDERIRSFVERIGTDVDAAYREELEKELQMRSALVDMPVSAFPKEWLDAIANEVAQRHKGTPVRIIADRIIDETESVVSTTNVIDGVIDSEPLRAMIRANLSAKWPDTTPDVYATALRKGAFSQATGKWDLVSWHLNPDPAELRIEKILASAAIPGVFKSVAINGVAYVDGGWEDMGGDNNPIRPIVDNHPEIKTIIVVYLNDRRNLTGRIRKSDFPAIRIIEVLPSCDIGQWITGSLNFDTDKARRLIILGREDARKALKEAGLSR